MLQWYFIEIQTFDFFTKDPIYTRFVKTLLLCPLTNSLRRGPPHALDNAGGAHRTFSGVSLISRPVWPVLISEVTKLKELLHLVFYKLPGWNISVISMPKGCSERSTCLWISLSSQISPKTRCFLGGCPWKCGCRYGYVSAWIRICHLLSSWM